MPNEVGFVEENSTDAGYCIVRTDGDGVTTTKITPASTIVIL